MPSPKKCRLDELLVEKGLADSRSRAKALILAGKVMLGTERLDKPGRSLPVESDLTVERPPRFVSRGGEKLEGFLDRFAVSVEGQSILDVGASTGGFTDCCLQRGARSSSCVDVGRAQLHNKLVQDPRVVNIEKTNARSLKTGDLPDDSYPRIVMDLSFISLTKVLPAVWAFLQPGGCLIALVKPQFEAGRGAVGHGGVVRDAGVRAETVRRICRNLEDHSWRTLGLRASPVAGPKGNREVFVYAAPGAASDHATLEEWIREEVHRDPA